MSYYARGHGGNDEIDDFDEYDPTPYGGGYDQSLTYGRPLPPSAEICYSSSSSSGNDNFDYDRPSYTSSSQPSAYGDEALDNEYQSYSRSKPRPSGGSGYGGESVVYGGAPSAFGSNYDAPPTSQYGRKNESSEYGRKNNEYESGYGGRKNETDAPSYGYGSGGGRKSSGYDEPSSEYGSGYGRKTGYGDEPGHEKKSSYGRKSDDDDDDDEKPRYGRKKYGDNDSDDSDDDKKKHRHHHRKHYDD